MTYYLKYRPQTLDELDLTQVRESLTKIVRSKKIPHAFLFSGPRGTGKTSAARILAKIVNCESTSVKLRGSGKIAPCNRCTQCRSITKGANIDIIELDAASHRGIDDVRTLRDAVKLTPARAKKKVYIIDEAHMLTTEASNALLKTLEEPPEHVMFIMATTNPEKLIETIRSRTTNIVFQKATNEEIVRSLKKVKKGEKLKIKDSELKLIAEKSDGSFRDATKILEQLVGEVRTLSTKNVEKFLRKGGGALTKDLFDHLSDKNTKEALLFIEENISAGAEAKKLGESVLGELRDSLRAKFEIGEGGVGLFKIHELVGLLKLFSQAVAEIPTSPIEHLPLELAVIKWCENTADNEKVKTNNGNKKDSSHDVPEELIEKNIKKKPGRAVDNSEVKVEKKVSEKMTKSPTVSDGSVTDDVWKNILGEIKPKNSTTEALLRAARPLCYDGEILTLGVFYSFHKEQLEQVVHKRVLEDVCGQIMGSKVGVVCKLSKPPKKPVSTVQNEAILTESDPGGNSNQNQDMPLTENGDGDIINIAKEIFGGG